MALPVRSPVPAARSGFLADITNWLTRQARITLQFTLTSGSWLHLVEVFFGIITRHPPRTPRLVLSNAPVVAGCHGETCEDGAVPRLVDDTALTELAVVANNTMNRERGLSAYRAELGLDPISGLGAGGWLDLCCGSARALIEAAGRGHRLVGVDLVERAISEEPRLLPCASVSQP